MFSETASANFQIELMLKAKILDVYRLETEKGIYQLSKLTPKLIGIATEAKQRALNGNDGGWDKLDIAQLVPELEELQSLLLGLGYWQLERIEPWLECGFKRELVWHGRELAEWLLDANASYAAVESDTVGFFFRRCDYRSARKAAATKAPREAEIGVSSESAPAAANAIRKERDRTQKTPRRRRKRQPTTRPLTVKQIEASKLHGECEGKIAEVAKRMGISWKTASGHIKAAYTKLGKRASLKAKTTALNTDRRGQVDVTKSDDQRG